MKNAHTAIALVFLGLIFGISQSVFILPETHQAMVIQFGNPVGLHTEPGLKFKIPVIDQVALFDKRVLDLDAVPEEVLLADRKRIVVDTFARYRIIDMLAFRNALQNEQLASTRLNDKLSSTMRAALGNATLTDLLSDKRSRLMANIRQQVNEAVDFAGIEIVDVRIGKADLPEQTSQSIFARMRTEREREAAEFRAQGQEQALEIRSKADKERTILLAEAEKQAETLRGQGDEEAIKAYARAFNRDAEFYSFYRTMQAYRESLPGESTTLILSPEGEFFRYFESKGR